MNFSEKYLKNSDTFEYGWIDKDGNSYNTKYEGHSLFADDFCDNFHIECSNCESFLERNGWIKVTAIFKNGRFEKRVFLGSDEEIITNKQLEKLCDLELLEIDYVPYYIENM